MRPGQLGRLVLAVRVHRHDQARARRERQPVAGAKAARPGRGSGEDAAAAPAAPGARHRVVGRAVVDDDRVEAEARISGGRVPRTWTMFPASL